MHRVLEALCRLLAPILAFTADEAWEFAGHAPRHPPETFPVPDPAFAGTEATAEIEQLLKQRALSSSRRSKRPPGKTIGSNLEAEIVLTVPDAATTPADLLDDEASVQRILHGRDPGCRPGRSLTATATRTGAGKCQRCWRHLPEVGRGPVPDLCSRCADVLGS